MAERDHMQAESAPQSRPQDGALARTEVVDRGLGAEFEDAVARLEAVESILDHVAGRLSELFRHGGRLEAVEKLVEQLSVLPDRVEARMVESESALAERHSADLERVSDLIVEETRRAREADQALEGDLKARLAAAEQRSISVTDSLSGRLDALERDALAAEAAPGDPQASGAGPSSAPPSTEPEPADTGADGSVEVYEINEVTFEQLRALGCSSTQAARILGRRSSVGPFEGADALDQVPGLPAEFRASLKQRLRAG